MVVLLAGVQLGIVTTSHVCPGGWTPPGHEGQGEPPVGWLPPVVVGLPLPPVLVPEGQSPPVGAALAQAQTELAPAITAPSDAGGQADATQGTRICERLCCASGLH